MTRLPACRGERAPRRRRASLPYYVVTIRTPKGYAFLGRFDARSEADAFANLVESSARARLRQTRGAIDVTTAEENARDRALRTRAMKLAARYLPDVLAPYRVPSFRWTRSTSCRIGERPPRSRVGDFWGACHPKTGLVRINEAMKRASSRALDHVLVHELVHMKERTHGRAFQSLMRRYPWVTVTDHELRTMATRFGADPDGMWRCSVTG